MVKLVSPYRMQEYAKVCSLVNEEQQGHTVRLSFQYSFSLEFPWICKTSIDGSCGLTGGYSRPLGQVDGLTYLFIQFMSPREADPQENWTQGADIASPLAYTYVHNFYKKSSKSHFQLHSSINHPSLVCGNTSNLLFLDNPNSATAAMWLLFQFHSTDEIMTKVDEFWARTASITY